MNVSIIIPNYNGEKLLKKNLPEVFKAAVNYKNGEVEIIFVDDGSIDKSTTFIKSQISKLKTQNFELKLLKNQKNLGFSSTVNHGAREAKGDILVLLNTDVIPEKNFLEPLIEHFKDNDVFAVGCMDKSVEDNQVILRGRGIGKWQRGFLVHERGEVNKNNTLWVSGGSGAFRKSIWDKLSGLNELYNPFYYEDIDLSYRALKSGYKLLFEPDSVALHEHQKGIIRRKYSNFKVKTIAYKNQFIFVWENATDIDIQFLHFLWLPYHFIKAVIRLDWAFFLGFFEAFILLPKVIKFSFKAQKLFIKSDKEVVKEFEK